MSTPCQLCGIAGPLTSYVVHGGGKNVEDTVGICVTCTHELNSASINADHWRCLREAIWSPVPAVQVLAYRVLKKAENETWAQDILSGAYLEDDVLAWANVGLASAEAGTTHKDSNGASLAEGDTVTLIKDLEVKGAGFTAKRGTSVKGIHLTENPEHIEGKINGQVIVILTQYVKKAG